MSGLPLRGSTSRSSKSFLNEPIQYRQVVHRRAGKDEQQLSVGAQTPKPLHSRLHIAHGLQKSESRRREQVSSSTQQLSVKVPIAGSRMQTGRFNKASSRLSITVNHQPGVISRQGSRPYQRASTIASRPNLLRNQSSSVPLDPKFASNPQKPNIEKELRMLEKRLDALVQAKLKLTVETTKNSQLAKKKMFISQRKALNQQLQNVIGEIRALGKQTSNSHQINVFTRKIDFIQRLMAEQTAEAQILKKHYYEQLSNHNMKRLSLSNSSIVQKTREAEAIERRRNKTINSPDKQKLKPLFKESLSKQSYRSPKQGDYESYRYKHRPVAPNIQPLPRSSYKRDYLIMKPEPQKKIINKDHSPYHPQSKRPVGSSYIQEFRKQKTQVTNHRELDAYRNKIRTIKVSYMPVNRRQATIGYDSDDYQQERGSRILRKSPGREGDTSRISHQQSEFNRKVLLSEAARQFKGDRSEERSRAKDSQLKHYHYQLRKMFNV